MRPELLSFMAIEGRAEVLEAVERARVAMRLLGAIWPTRERAVMARAEEAIGRIW
jgi:hypothetical protein